MRKPQVHKLTHWRNRAKYELANTVRAVCGGVHLLGVWSWSVATCKNCLRAEGKGK